jgi:hypothetical protein
MEHQCAYCGGPPDDFDHVPPRFFLDDPFPESLYKVGSCRACNNGASRDEQYVGCLIDVALVGSVSDAGRLRPKVWRTLGEQPALAARLDASRAEGQLGVSWNPEMDRVRKVASKLAQGHAAFELSQPMFRDPDRLEVFPLTQLSEEERRSFESVPAGPYWPEVGSRAMIRMVEGGPDMDGGWVVVQAGRYRYLASAADGALVRIVLSEYLGCEAIWE